MGEVKVTQHQLLTVERDKQGSLGPMETVQVFKNEGNYLGLPTLTADL